MLTSTPLQLEDWPHEARRVVRRMTAAVATRPVTAPGLFSRGLRELTIGAVALVSLLAFGSLAVATVMPTVADALDGLALYGAAFGGPFAAGVVAMVVAGIWCDTRGPLGPTGHGAAWFVVGLLIAGAAPSMGVLAAGRIVQGFGSGLLSVSLYVAVGQAYPEDLRRRVFAAFAAAWVVPSLLGPAIAGLIVQYAGWRWVFLAVPVLAVPAVLLVRRALSRPIGPAGSGASSTLGSVAGAGSGRLPVAAGRRIGWAVGAGAGAALLHVGGQQRGAWSPVLLALAAVALLVCVPRLLPAGFARARRGLPTVIALRGLAGAAFAGAEVLLPLLLSREHGLPPAGAGLVLVIGALAWSAGSWLQARLTGLQSPASLPRVGMLAIAAGVGAAALLTVPSVPVAVGMVGWGLAGLGMGLAYPVLSALTLDQSAPAEQGRNSAALQLADSVGTAVVLAATGALLAAAVVPGPRTYLAGFAVSGVLAVIGTLLAGRVVPSAADATVGGGPR